MDFLARTEMGLVKTIPDGMSPGSDTANLSVLGTTLPSIIQAITARGGAGVSLGPTDVAMRCNLVTLSDGSDISDTVMVIIQPEKYQLMRQDSLKHCANPFKQKS